MQKLQTQHLTRAAAVGAAYAVLSLFSSVFSLTFGVVQCRFSEALCVLPFFFPETVWGLFAGCLITNLLSPYGLLDLIVGSLATLIAALLTARCRKKWLAPLPPVVLNTLLVGAVIAYEETGLTAAFPATWAINGLTVGAGEAIACYGLGMLPYPTGDPNLPPEKEMNRRREIVMGALNLLTEGGGSVSGESNAVFTD